MLRKTILQPTVVKITGRLPVELVQLPPFCTGESQTLPPEVYRSAEKYARWIGGQNFYQFFFNKRPQSFYYKP